MKTKNSLILFFILTFVLSCDKKRIFDQYQFIGNFWDKDTIISFSFYQEDTLSLYNSFINIRNNDHYPYENLFLIISLEQPNGMIQIDTLEYLMANPDGTLLGKGFSDIKENKLWYKENINFPKKGNYTLKIQHATREMGKVQGVQKLEGISEIGFRLESKE